MIVGIKSEETNSYYSLVSTVICNTTVEWGMYSNIVIAHQPMIAASYCKTMLYNICHRMYVHYIQLLPYKAISSGETLMIKVEMVTSGKTTMVTCCSLIMLIDKVTDYWASLNNSQKDSPLRERSWKPQKLFHSKVLPYKVNQNE